MESLTPDSRGSGSIVHKYFSHKRTRNQTNGGGGGGLIDGFNEVSNNIASGYLKVGNDSMSEIRFCTT